MNTTIDASAQANVQAWLDGSYDEETKQAIREMMKNPEELNESFYRNLEFGTGGLRGIMGVGTNRMNKYTVAMATQGLANYVRKCFSHISEPKVAISYDCRNHSHEFANITAHVFAANGFKVFLFAELRPTPELSFAIRHLGCQTGVMITASHNPREYNGYKAYWDDGCQLTAPHDTNVIDEVLKIKDISDVKVATDDDNITLLGFELDDAYLSRILQNTIHPDLPGWDTAKIVYSPLYGTGTTVVPAIFSRLGINNLLTVKEQCTPNGDFPTAPYPNPEEKAAMTLAVDLANQSKADIALATDPDADRVGMAIRRPDGEMMLLNGNQTLSIIVYYVLNEYKKTHRLQPNDYIIKTIVTSELPAAIAKALGVKVYDVLTGFKFIGAKIHELEGKERFLCGGEESFGYLISDHVRDKDAVASCAMIAEIATWGRQYNKTLFDILVDIYCQYGFYKESLLSVVRKGKQGAIEIQEMMKNYRENPPTEINGSPVVCIKDYKLHVSKDLRTGATETLDLPTSNVLQFFTADGAKVTVRPSGTEPKIKYYFSVQEPLTCKEDYDKVEKALDAKIEAIKQSLNLQ